MASTPLFDIFRIKDLRDRIFFTLGILLVFRLGAVLPIPGINGTALKHYFTQQQSNGTSLTDYFDFFSGGAFHNFSIFMLAIMPYISMSIIMQFIIVVFPSFKKIPEEDGGKKKIQPVDSAGHSGRLSYPVFCGDRICQKHSGRRFHPALVLSC